MNVSNDLQDTNAQPPPLKQNAQQEPTLLEDKQAAQIVLLASTAQELMQNQKFVKMDTTQEPLKLNEQYEISLNLCLIIFRFVQKDLHAILEV